MKKFVNVVIKDNGKMYGVKSPSDFEKALENCKELQGKGVDSKIIPVYGCEEQPQAQAAVPGKKTSRVEKLVYAGIGAATGIAATLAVKCGLKKAKEKIKEAKERIDAIRFGEPEESEEPEIKIN